MPIPIVIDSDAYNELDDQFAIAYALCRPQLLAVQAMMAAPFMNERVASPAEGMTKSLAEMRRICDLCHSIVPLYAGSTAYLPEDGGHEESPACNALIHLALSMPEGKRLYVAAIAALTNVASALLKAPQIKDRIVIYWLGGHARDFSDQSEFNLRQDRRAAQVVLDSGAPVVWFPCRGVCSHLSLSLWEASHWMQGKNPLADALLQFLRESGTVGMGQSRILWDIAPIAALCNPRCVQTEPIPSPIVTEGRLRFPPERHLVDSVQMVSRDQVFADFFAAIGDFAPEGTLAMPPPPLGE